MESDYLSSGYAREKEIRELEDRVQLLRGEVLDLSDTAHGRPRKEIEEEIAGLEAKLKLLQQPIEPA